MPTDKTKPGLNPFSESTAYDTTESKAYEEQGNKFTNYADGTTNKAKEDSRALEKEQHDRPKESLDPNAGKNIAQGQSQYGMINNRNYAQTLRLAREADAYNNKPQDHIVRYGSAFGSGIRDMGTGYDRPQIQTMETRAMNQAYQLDTNQKQLAQQLQDAVNHKDLNAFIQLYQQLYNITLTREEAVREFRRFERQVVIQQTMQRNMTKFNSQYGRFFSAETLEAINNLVTKGHSIYAKDLAGMLTGSTTASEQAQLEEAIVNGYMESVFGPDWQYDGKNANEKMRHYQNFKLRLQNEFMKLKTEQEKGIKG